MLRPTLCIAALMMGAAFPVVAAPAAPALVASSNAAIRAELRAILDAAYPDNGPGASVIVTRGGQTLLLGARGLADIAAKRPIQPGDRQHLASITKMLTAATVVSLAADGKLSLDDPLSKFLSGFNASSASATVRQLLNHSSGVKDLTKVPGFISANRDKDFTTAELVELVRKQAPTAAPGAAWEYNNSGYLLLGAIIEKGSGKPWSEAVAERITRPLGLASISLSGPAILTYDGADAAAKPYPPETPSLAGSAGGLVGNAADLARFAAALHHGKLVPPALYKEMTAPAKLKDGKSAPYGFGFRIGRLLGSPTYYQGGAMRGVRTETLYLPKEDVFVAVLANSDAPQSAPRPLAERLAAAAAGHAFPVFVETKPDLAALAPMFGRYADGPREFLFFGRGGQLWFASKGSSARPVKAAGNSRFYFSAEDAAWFELVPGADGGTAMRLHVPEDREAHDAAFAGPLPKAPAATADKAIAGQYRTETNVVLTVTVAADGQINVSQGDKPVGPLRAIEGGQFAIDGTPMRLEFVREGGKVTGMKMYRGARTLNAVKLP